MPDKKILAIIGPMGSGKTTFALLLEEKHGYHRTRFADGLKKMLGAFLYTQGAQTSEIHQMLDGNLKEIPTKYLDGRTPRHAMQTLGTEWRDLISKTLWSNAWANYIDTCQYDKIVVDDMRFLHEAKKIRELNGQIIKILRPNINTTSTHSSEVEYKEIISHYTIINARNPEYMIDQLNYLLSKDVP